MLAHPVPEGPAAESPEGTEVVPLDWETYCWAHDKYERLIGHEDDLLGVRAGFFFLVEGVLISVLVTDFVLSPTHQDFLTVAAVSGLIGVIWSVFNYGPLISTSNALSVWKSEIQRLEKSAPTRATAAQYDLFLRPFTAYAESYSLRSVLKKDRQRMIRPWMVSPSDSILVIVEVCQYAWLVVLVSAIFWQPVAGYLSGLV